MYNIFLSHSWSYSDAYEHLINLLHSKPYFTFKDYSVPKNDPVHNASNEKELYQAIYNKIKPCHIVIIMAGVYASYSKWIQKEIQIAKKDFNKPLLAVKPWAQTNVSQIVMDNADELVNWNTDSIVETLSQLP